jgi:hypothetical protein
MALDPLCGDHHTAYRALHLDAECSLSGSRVELLPKAFNFQHRMKIGFAICGTKRASTYIRAGRVVSRL